MTKRARRDAERRGRRAEWIAVWWLRFKGYSVLTTRYKRPTGEIDIVAKHKQTIVFIEVKQRQTLRSAQMAVPLSTWHRIARTAELWAAAHPASHRADWRYDLIVFGASGWPKHFRDYWRP